MADPRGTIVRFVSEPPPKAPEPTEVTVVLDTAWTSPAEGGERLIGLRDLAADVLMGRDLWDEALRRLDEWAEVSGIVEAMTVDGVSYWYRRRLGAWWWLERSLLWLGIVQLLADRHRPAALETPAEGEPDLHEACRLLGELRDIEVRRTANAPQPGGQPGVLDADEVDAALQSASDEAPTTVLGRIRKRLRDRERRRRRQAMERRLQEALARRRPLLVLTEHARQQIGIGRRSRLVNVYLDPILDRLAGTSLEPVELQLEAVVDDDASWANLAAGARHGALAGERLRKRYGQPEDREAVAAEVDAMVAAIGQSTARLLVGGVDVAPGLRSELQRSARNTVRSRLRERRWAQRMLAEMRPAAVLLANEYNRTEWIAAARAEGIPVAAVQHGIIHPWHPGYIHRTRPAELALADRTYVFGRWERRLLVERSRYRPDEVVVGGSPRLDYVVPEVLRERDAVRRELGVRRGNRLVVVSTTWAELHRRFDLPVSLAALFDRPLPGVHIVLKLHPRERDEGAYRQLLEGLAEARGIPLPPLSIVQRTDLYRLLAAADAHLGFYSTVNTEAVVTGTPNLLAAAIATGDLLDYVEAGVAIPVRDGGELLDALDRVAASGLPAEARAAFLVDHFEPGAAGERIRDDLSAWLGRVPAG
jgi:CDP-Glycerol:Poly(glycerophosphate) glycerophosphotransferase